MSQNFHQFLLLGEKQFVTIMKKSQIFEVYENFKFEDLNDDALDIGRCMVFQTLVFHPNTEGGRGP